MAENEDDSINRFLRSIGRYTPLEQDRWRTYIHDRLQEYERFQLDVWDTPFAKLVMPVLLGLVSGDDFQVSRWEFIDVERDSYTYAHAGRAFLVSQFEPYRSVIEEMWHVPVIIEAVFNLPGCVRVRPRPKLPAVIPLGPVEPGRVVFGTDLLTADVAMLNASEIPHLLIMGTTGFGKSVFLHQLVRQLLAAPAGVVDRLTLVDLKGGVEFMHYQEEDARVRAVWQFEGVVEAVSELVDLMQARQQEMLERRWRTYRGGRVFFVVDEFAQIQLWPVEGKEGRQVHERLLANLNRLAMLGRSAGIVLVAAVQKATTDVMDSSFRTNLQGQLCFRMPNRLAAASMFGSVDELKVDPVALPRGQFIFYDPTVGRTRYLQAHVTES